jgi:hypothetical protein
MARGGTRYGAGRPGHRLVAENSQRIDVRRWHKMGYLKAGASFSWQWTRESEKVGSIGVEMGSDQLRLNYSLQSGDGHWRDASQTIWISSSPCHYGGSRPWFDCPVCHRRAGLLYLRSGRFACRSCQRVSYRAQSGSVLDRVCARYHRLTEKLEAGKPRWQRWATFDKLVVKYEAAGAQMDASLDRQLLALGFPV